MNEAPLDDAVLDILIEHIGAEGAGSVIELFLVECRELTATIAATAADRGAIRRAAHSLKSSAGQLGAMALSEAAALVERDAATGSATLPDAIAALCEHAGRAEGALAARLLRERS